MFDADDYWVDSDKMPCNQTKALAIKHNDGFKRVGTVFQGLLGDSDKEEKATLEMIDTARIGWMYLNTRKLALLFWVMIALGCLWILQFLGVPTQQFSSWLLGAILHLNLIQGG
jgi:hypothetical protein